MTALETLQAYVIEILTERAATLEHWRQQVPTLSGHPKNFENWLLVELVHKLRAADADPLRTNGYVTYRGKKRMPSFWSSRRRFSDLQRWLGQEGITSRRIGVQSLNPDISAVLPGARSPVNVDIKTQIHAQEVLADVLIAKWHNEREKRRDYHQAFLWVLVEPRDEPFQSRFRRSVERRCDKAKKRWDVDLTPRQMTSAPGVSYTLAAPGLKPTGL